MVTSVRTPPKRPITTAKYNENACLGDCTTTLTAAQLLVAMLNVEVDLVCDLRTLGSFGWRRAEQRGNREEDKSESETSELHLVYDGGGSDKTVVGEEDGCQRKRGETPRVRRGSGANHHGQLWQPIAR